MHCKGFFGFEIFNKLFWFHSFDFVGALLHCLAVLSILLYFSVYSLILIIVVNYALLIIKDTRKVVMCLEYQLRMMT